MSLTKKECQQLVHWIKCLHNLIEIDAEEFLPDSSYKFDKEGYMINKYGEKVGWDGLTKEENSYFEPCQPSMLDNSLFIIHSDIFKKLQTRAEKPDREIDDRSREEKLKDPNYILCKRCDLVLAKRHIRRHEKTARCLEIYKKKVATQKSKSTIVEQQELINLDKKDKDDILKIYEEDEELLKLIEEENRRLEEEEP